MMAAPRDGVPTRLLAFLESNPDEDLTMAGIAAKFNTTRGYAKNVVARLRAKGLIVTEWVVRRPR